jgi:polysaccharide deacetylase family protein (PEP-CTERM system associated)
MIASAGHEIASHGYGHELIYRQKPEQFEVDVRRSMDIIQAQVGQPPVGYRAPAFSITRRSLWAGPILAKLGFRYSSSVFPIRKRRYGLPNVPRSPHRWPDSQLIEFPLTTVRIAGRNWPACGGGYTRLLPAAVMAYAIRSLNHFGHPAVIYLHPYELAAGEVAAFAHSGIPVSAVRRFTQELWRSRVQSRLSQLFEEFGFSTMSAALAENPVPQRPQAPMMSSAGWKATAARRW